MKTVTFFMLSLAGIYNNIYGQHLTRMILAARIPLETPVNENLDPTPHTCSISPQKKISAYKIAIKLSDDAYHLQKSKIQKLNCAVVISAGSIIGFSGMRRGSNIYNDRSFSNTVLHTDINQYKTGARLAKTGLFIIAGSMPFFINSLRAKNSGDLKFACQKTSFGASNKSYKKVTGLTFSVPVGR